MKLNKIEGTIMYKDTELCRFSYNDGFVEYEPIGTDPTYTPWEFMEGYSAAAITDWLFDRLPEDNRQGLPEACAKRGIPMTGEAILHISYGRTLDDQCWIKFSDGPQHYNEIKEPFRD